jgi:hypothetical protein
MNTGSPKMNTRPHPGFVSSASEARRAPALAALRSFPRVEQATPPAWALSQRALTGSKSRGSSYEKKVGKVLDKICSRAGWNLLDHQWFVYICGKEVKYFQPDFVVERPAGGVLIEVKLTYVDASLQINKYLEYLKLFGLDCFPVMVVRHLTSKVKKDLIVDDFDKVQSGVIWHLWV